MLSTCLRPGFRPGLQLARIMECGLYPTDVACCAAGTGPQVIQTLPKADDVRGVTLINNELYVLRDRQNDQIDVYSTSDFTLLRRLSLPRLINTSFTDMASCERKQCVYMSESHKPCIHRLGLDGSVSRWPMRSIPWGLAVTRTCNLLVTCSDEDGGGKLVELSSDDGSYVREVRLQADIHAPWHAVLLDVGQYVVVHGHLPDNSRITRVSDDGRILQSNVGDSGLYEPRHLAVDNHGFVFVADSWNNRISLFDPSLNYVRDVVSGMPDRPQYLCFHEVLQRLYVGHSGRTVVVVHLDSGQSETRL